MFAVFKILTGDRGAHSVAKKMWRYTPDDNASDDVDSSVESVDSSVESVESSVESVDSNSNVKVDDVMTPVVGSGDVIVQEKQNHSKGIEYQVTR